MPKRGRPQLPESPTRRLILKAAAWLFRSKGYKKVTIEDICIKAGASKMTFYRHFKDKGHIAFTILELFFEAEILWADQVLQSDIPFLEKMNQFLSRKEKNQEKLGIIFLTEFNQVSDPRSKVFEDKWTKKITQTNVKFLEQGQALEFISEKMKPDVFLFFIKKRNDLIMDKDLMAICPDFKTRFEVVNDFFYFGLRKRVNHGHPQ